MKLMYHHKARNILLAVVFSVGFSFATSVFSSSDDKTAYLIDLNSKEVTYLGTLSSSVYLSNGARSDYQKISGFNDAGQVVGSFYTTDYDEHAFITGPNGLGMTDLTSHRDSYASGINDAGQVVETASRLASTFSSPGPTG